jgi:DNA polymerase III alpha subunit (gram-positive type)
MNDNRILWVDVETTGLDANQHHIVQIAATAEYGSKIEDFSIYIKPPIFPMDYDLAAGRVTGLTKDYLVKNGVSIQDAYVKFKEFLCGYIKPNSKVNKFFLAGKNIGFDRKFLEAFFIHNEDEFIKYFYPLEINVDTLVAYLISGREINPKNQRLETIAQALEISLAGIDLHNAIDDIKLTRLVFKKCLEKIKVL